MDCAKCGTALIEDSDTFIEYPFRFFTQNDVVNGIVVCHPCAMKIMDFMTSYSFMENYNKLNSKWKALAKEVKSEKISAIKAYRDRYPFNDPRRVGLKEAKDTVEEYMAKNGYDH